MYSFLRISLSKSLQIHLLKLTSIFHPLNVYRFSALFNKCKSTLQLRIVPWPSFLYLFFSPSLFFHSQWTWKRNRDREKETHILQVACRRSWTKVVYDLQSVRSCFRWRHVIVLRATDGLFSRLVDFPLVRNVHVQLSADNYWRTFFFFYVYCYTVLVKAVKSLALMFFSMRDQCFFFFFK